MANTSSAKKAVRAQARKKERNAAIRNAIRTIKKEAMLQLQATTPEKAGESVLNATSKLDKALAKGIIHKNKAARSKSRLARRLNVKNS